MIRKLFLGLIIIIFFSLVSYAELLSFKTLLADPGRYDNKNIMLWGVVDRVVPRSDAGDGFYYEIDIDRDITVIVEQGDLEVVKKLRVNDLVEIQGIFYSMHQYRRMVYNNLLIADFVRRLESS